MQLCAVVLSLLLMLLVVALRQARSGLPASRCWVCVRPWPGARAVASWLSLVGGGCVASRRGRPLPTSTARRPWRCRQAGGTPAVALDAIGPGFCPVLVRCRPPKATAQPSSGRPQLAEKRMLHNTAVALRRALGAEPGA
jgi:hypothetical protein